MTTNTLYIYESINPATGKKRTRKTLTQNPSYGTFIGTAYRLIADAGKVLTDGIITTSCIDTDPDNPVLWTEIDEPTPEPEGESND